MRVVAELRAFLAAALPAPVPRDHHETDAAFRHRRRVAGLTLVAGAVVLGIALRQEPGNPTFYVWTLLLAVIWAVGGWWSGPLHLGYASTRSTRTSGRYARPWVQSVALGVLVIALFLAGAVIVARVPALREPVTGLLAHARYGSLPIVAALTVVNGIAEEIFFRGGLYAAVGRHRAVTITTAVYAATTLATGNPMLVFAAVLLGLLTGAQRRVTGGVLGPVITHVMWSSAMLLLLPPILEALR